SRGSVFDTAVASTTLSPMRTTHEPCACFASLPVSNVSFLPPESSITTSCFIIHPSLSRRAPLRGWSFARWISEGQRRLPKKGPEKRSFRDAPHSGPAIHTQQENYDSIHTNTLRARNPPA